MLLRLVHAVAQSIERLVDLWLFQVGRRGCHAVDRIHFRANLPMLIGNDPILRPGLRNTNGLRDTLEEIHHRRAAQLKCIGADVLLQCGEAVRLGLFEIEKNLKRCAETAFIQTVDSGQIEKEELLRKAEVLLQQAVAEKTAVGIWQDAFISIKTHLPQAASRKNGRRQICRCRQRTERDSQRVQEQKFVQCVNGGALSIQIKSQRTYRQLTEAEPARTLHLDPDDGRKVGPYAGRNESIRYGDGCVAHSQRPQRHRIAGSKRAELTISGLAVNWGA